MTVIAENVVLLANNSDVNMTLHWPASDHGVTLYMCYYQQDAGKMCRKSTKFDRIIF